jgi:hypothetical protein
MPPKNTLADLRDHLFEQLEKLKEEADPTKLHAEIERSRAVVAVSATLIDTARVEVAMVRALDSTQPANARFFNLPDEQVKRLQDRFAPERPALRQIAK